MTAHRKAKLFIGFLRFCSWLPLPIAHLLGAVMGIIYFPFAKRDKHIIRTNLTIAFPQYSALARWWIMFRFFINLGKTFTELGALWLWEKDRLLPLVKEVRGQAYLDQALAQGKGAMLLCPHWGAWELMGVYWSALYGITNLYQPPDYPEIADFIKHSRERMGANLVPTDVSGVRALLSALKQNQLIGILPDQDPGETGGVFAPFFDKPANTIVLVGKLLKRSQSPVLFTVCERLIWGRGYRVHIIPASPDIYHEDPMVTATALNQGVEACVRLNPEQYVWNYKRWKRQPDSEKVY